MKKVYKITNLDCATCALKIEEALNKVAEIDRAKVNFMTEKITVETTANNLEALEKNIKNICKHVEPDACLEKEDE